MKIHATSRDGMHHELEGEAGGTVMELIRDALSEDPFAICGGQCSCATCHVYVESHDEDLPEMGDDEDELLDGSLHRRDNSRLSCQIRLNGRLDGLRVTVAPED